jgi:GTPase SAR1 family protein
MKKEDFTKKETTSSSSTDQPSTRTSMEQLKVLLVGDTGVGKSSLISRLESGQFQDDTEPTSGASYVNRTVDTVGQVRLPQLRARLARNPMDIHLRASERGEKKGGGGVGEAKKQDTRLC